MVITKQATLRLPVYSIILAELRIHKLRVQSHEQSAY